MVTRNFQVLSLLVVVAFCSTGLVSGGRQSKRYDNYHVFQVQPSSGEHLEFLKRYDGQRNSFVFLDALHSSSKKVHVVVSPEQVEGFEMALQTSSIDYEIVDRNAQSQLENDEVADPKRRNAVYDWSEYHTLNETYDWLHSLAAKYPNEVSIIHAGSTYEGREILGVKVSYGKTEKKAIFIEGGIHAREWISPATVTYILNELLTSDEPEVRMVAENFDWYIVPHANPDGFEYTHTTDRLWRKTVTPYGECQGADPNRNWGFHWNEVGASNNPCTDTYAGPEPFSEIETRTLSEYIESLRGKLFLYVSFHSYSQLLLYPYGHTSELPPNHADLKRIFDAAIEAMARRYGTKYTGGNIYDAIYPAAGASTDWAYGVVNVKYSFCYELRPTSLNFWTGFKLPANQIIPTGEETLDSLVEMIKQAGIIRYI